MKLKQYLKKIDINEIISKIENNCQPFFKDLKRCRKGDLLLSGRNNKPDFFMNKVRTDRTPRDTPENIHKLLDDVFYKKFGIRARSQTIFGSAKENQSMHYGQVYMIFPIGKYEVIWSNKIYDLYAEHIEANDYGQEDIPSWYYSKWKSDWLTEYGTNGTKGSWKYRDLEWKEKPGFQFDTMVKDIKKKYQVEDDDVSYEDLIWMPEISLERYLMYKEKEWFVEQKEYYHNVVISNYYKGNLKEALRSRNEIMLYCKSYYGLHHGYKNHIINYLIGE